MSRRTALGRRTRHRVATVTVAVVVAVGTGAARPPVTTIDATSPSVLGARVDCTDRNSCVVSWETARSPVRIYTGSAPDAIDRGTPLAVVRSGTSAALTTDPSGPRPYYEVVARGRHRGPVVADRFVGLDGAPATRDLGGYQTTDGRQTRWGMLFRSDGLDALTASDHQRLTAMGLPTHCPDPDITPVDTNTVTAAALAHVTDPVLRARDGALLRALARGPLPRFVSCTLLDDRVGWTSALVLTTLGVARETVVADHLAATPRAANLLPSRAPLDAAFQAVDDRYRSFGRYLGRGLGLDQHTYELLRERFTEKLQR